MTIAIDPVLIMWEAMNLLATARARSRAVDVAETLAEVEQVLVTALLEVIKSAETYRISNAAPTGRAIH